MYLCYVEAVSESSMVGAMDGLQRACAATQDSLFLFWAGAQAFAFPAMQKLVRDARPKVRPASFGALPRPFSPRRDALA